MSNVEAHEYMTEHSGDAPLVGWFVQRKHSGAKQWENMALTWDTIEGAQNHLLRLTDVLGGELRVCRCEHTPLL